MAGERDPHEFPMMAVSMQWCPARSRNACPKAGALNNWGGSDTRDGTSRESAMEWLWVPRRGSQGQALRSKNIVLHSPSGAARGEQCRCSGTFHTLARVRASGTRQLQPGLPRKASTQPQEPQGAKRLRNGGADHLTQPGLNPKPRRSKRCTCTIILSLTEGSERGVGST